MIPAPDNQAKRLSDITISTLILNSHKAGSMQGMVWANECVDPELRALHTTSAHNCQQMAYEMWQFMNARGYYDAPSMPRNVAATMTQAFQPAPSPGHPHTQHYMS
nr:spore coat protein [Caldalkalibacillus salinus]